MKLLQKILFRINGQEMLLESIKKLAEKIHPTVIGYRRHLHANPELSFLEKDTSAFIKKSLDEMLVPWTEMGDTGIVAVIAGSKPSDSVVALRADIDALPITELNETEYVSQRPGVMHACGHDAHTASLMGVSSILHALKDQFAGSVKLIFQPGEEKLPGGASLMIREGVLENPKPQTVIGQHVMPTIPAGMISIRKGVMMASMDEIRVAVYGKGGHGAMPHHNIDPVVISSHIIVALQQIISRNGDPFIPSVLSFGKLIADGSINIIPDKVSMEGTFRTVDEKWRIEAHERMKKMAEGIAAGMGGKCDFQITKGYPVLINNEKLTENVEIFAKSYLGSEQVSISPVMMISEDFAYYSQKTDSCFYLLGVGNKNGLNPFLHTANFDIDERALQISTGLMTYIALKQLGN